MERKTASLIMLRFLSRMSLYIVGSQLRTAVKGKSLRPLKKGEWVEFSCNFTLQKLVKIYGIKGGFVRLLLAAIFKLALRTNERRKKGLLFYKVAKKIFCDIFCLFFFILAKYAIFMIKKVSFFV